MSKLVNLGPGEFADRLTVLALKLLHGVDPAQRDQWRNEQIVLLTRLKATDPARWLEAGLELAAVNAALWTATDQLRELEGQREKSTWVNTQLYQAGELAFQILRWNDRRAELVDAINKASGDFVASDKGEK